MTNSIAVATPLVAPSGRVGTFTLIGEQRYVMNVEDLGVTFDLDRVRRERHELMGELLVRCSLPSARTVDGVLSAADFNCSGLQSRVTRAKFLADRARTYEAVDWIGLLEEFCQRVLTFDREGSGRIWMKDLPPVLHSDVLDLHGLRLLKDLPVLVFGDSGQGKSLLAVYLAGILAHRGMKVLYADWEFAGDEHNDRCRRLFGEAPPSLAYLRCDRPLVHDVERLKRIIKADGFEYLVCDSVAFAAAGTPESAEAAQGYYQSLRQLKIGSFHIAHVTKQAAGDDPGRQADKPFGSTFWAAGARGMWLFKSDQGPDQLTMALYPKKANTGPMGRAVGLQFDFQNDQQTITVTPVDVRDHRVLSAGMPLWQQMQGMVKRGAMTAAAIAAELDSTPQAVLLAAKRKDRTFTLIPGSDGIKRIGLLG